MRELLVLLVIIAVIAIIWSLRKQNAQAAEQRKVEEFRRLQAKANEADRAPIAATTVSSADRDAAPASVAARGTGMLQEAADRAAGLGFETATDEMEAMTADLEEAQRQADRAAERLTRRANEALAAVQAAAAAHGGAVPGDGTHDCPPDFPIKGNMPSQHYHTPGQASYNRTIPEVCFQSAAAAEAAGFSESGDEAGMRRGAATETVAGEGVAIEADQDGIEAVVVEAIEIRDREDAERGDVVAEAIAAADAASVPPGAIRGDGSRDCPPAYPVKGSQTAMTYQAPGAPAYEATVPELCFSNAESAEAAGFAAVR